MKASESLLHAQAYQREGCERLTMSISLGVQVSALQLYRLLLSHMKVAISRVLSCVSVRGFRVLYFVTPGRTACSRSLCPGPPNPSKGRAVMGPCRQAGGSQAS